MNSKDIILQSEYAKVKQSYLAAKKCGNELSSLSLDEGSSNCRHKPTSASNNKPKNIHSREPICLRTTVSRPTLSLTPSNNFDHNNIVALEQDFLVKLKTAGLRAGREISLVTLFRNISTARGNTVALLTSCIDDWVSYSDHIENSSNEMVDGIETNLAEVLQEKQLAEREAREAKDECARIQTTLKTINDEAAAQVEKMASERDNAILARRDDIEKIVRDTEVEIATIKANIVEEAAEMMNKARADILRNKAEIANDTVEKLKRDFRMREDKLELQLTKQEKKIQSMEFKLKESKDDANNQLNVLRRNFELKITVQNDKIKQSSIDTQIKREENEKKIDNTNSQWVSTLKTVESKVKTIIATKDNQIKDISRRAFIFEEKANTFENLISNLENGFEEFSPYP